MSMEIQIAGLDKLAEYKPSLTPDGEAMIQNALAELAMIGRVSNEQENASAVKAQVQCKEAIDLLEKTRVAIGKPALEFKRKVDDFFAQKKSELQAEMFRSQKLTGSYAQLQIAKQRAEENARKEELSRIEREREAALSKATSHDEREQLQAHYNERAAIESRPPENPLPRPKGQVVRTDWEITVTDPLALARMHPSCVKIEPKLTEIKALLNAGLTLAGVTAVKATTAGVRAPRGSTIDV